ncbi:CAP domain-containing protein [Actinoplanes sp. KI2]|uniref:CAP domain-containing protein n=1 Tax=Actinoplanes sp. KI2 TaxID=2983315 RepID=UPI0021D606CF|nr:CAP domain-containing protein [Actinoplanes sp. KI2]MCU7728063.1 CAP domain-containing protein [Actinoplanes sp. KI2]
MRRKRLVVVAAATSALVLAGGMAATTAGAQVTPKLPGATLPEAAQRAAPGPPATVLRTAARRIVTHSDISNNPMAPMQQRVLDLINLNRRRAGCGALSLDRRLIAVANLHAADMARRHYFAHNSPRGDSPGDRVRKAGYHWRQYGENIARGFSSAYDVVNGWMHSAPHRANILDCRLHQMGIGLAIGRGRTAYWVQDFATPMT